MSDPLAGALAKLAPAVDLGASRELFERARDGGATTGVHTPHRGRWMLAAACVVLLVAGVAGVWALSGRDEPVPGSTSSPNGAGRGTEFEVLAVEPVADPDARSIRAAGTYDDLVSIVSRFGPTFAPRATEIDFDNQVALVFERPGSSSPDELTRFDATPDAWSARFERPSGDIEDIGLGYAYLVAVERSALTGVESFVMPAEQRGNITWDELRVAVPGTSSTEGDTERPPVPGPDELASRLRRFPVPNAFDPISLLQLSDAHDHGEDWTGTLTGVLFQDVPAGEWWICWEINESFPEQCGTGIRLLSAPALALAQPDLFDEQRSGDTGPPAVIISRDPLEVTGTWFDDAAIFVEDAAQDAFGTVLFETAGTTRPGAVLIASSQRDLAPMWERVGIAAEPPQVDFERSILVLFTVVDDACAASFGGLSVGNAADPAAPVVRPLLVEEDHDLCGESAEVRSFVVLVDRSRLPSRFTFAFPDEYAGDGPVRTAIDINAGFVVDVTVDAEFAIEPGRVLLIDATPNRFAQVLAADDATTYDAMWAQVGSGLTQPEVDFERDVVVAFVIPDDACPPEFDGFDTSTGPDGSIWTPVLRETSSTCRLPLVNRLVLAAVGRKQFDDSVTFRLPPNPVDGYDEQLFTLVRSGVVTLVERACGPADGPALAVQIQLESDEGARVDVRRGDTVLGSADAEATTGAAIGGRFVHEVLVPLTSSAAIGDEVLVRIGASDTPRGSVTVDASMLATPISCG